MGDRAWASINVGGHIETIEEAQDLLDAFVEDNLFENLEDAQTAMRSAVETKADFDAEDNEVNYATFDAIEAHVRKHHNLWCSTNHAAGSDYGAGYRTIWHDGDEIVERACENSNEGPLIPLSEIIAATKDNNADTSAYNIAVIIEKTQKAAGIGFPTLSVSPAVSAWLKIFGAPT